MFNAMNGDPLLRSLHTGDIFFLIRTSMYVFKRLFFHEYFHTAHEYYPPIKWRNLFSKQGRFYCAFAPGIKTSTNHLVLFNYEDHNRSTRRLLSKPQTANCYSFQPGQRQR